MAAKLEDVIERLKTEGYLTRWKSDYSIKNLHKRMEGCEANLMAQTNILQEMLELQREQSKDAERQNKLLFGRQSNSAPAVPKPQATSSDTGSGGGGRLSGGLGLGVGIAAVGAGLAGFIAAITGVGSLSFTGENLPDQAKNIALAMNEFAKMDNRAVAMIGGLLAGGVILSKFSGITGLIKAPIGMAAVGLGLGGFMAGIAAASEGMDFAGLDLDAFPKQAENLVAGMNELSNLNDKAIIIMGSMLAAGALLSQTKGGMGRVGKAAVGMTAVGLGIGGFMAGVAAAGDITGFTGENFAIQSKNMVAGISELGNLSETSIAILGAIALSGGLMAAAPGGLTVAGKAAVGMGLAGLGIGGFMAGIAAAGDLTGFDGATFATQAGNLATGLKAIEGLSDSTKTALVAIAGVVAGVTTVMPIAGAKLTGGMALAGFGIGSFFTGFALAFDLADAAGKKLLGNDGLGSGFVTLMDNAVKAINKAASIEIPADNFENYKLALTNLGQALTSFAKESLVQNLAKAGSAILSFFTFGASDPDPKNNPITTITSSLKDVETTELAKSATALNDVAIALEKLSKIGNLSMVGRNFENFAKSLLGTTPLLHLLYHGGEYGAGWFDGLKEVSLDKKYALKTLMEDGTLGKVKLGTESMGEILRSMNMGMNPNLYVTPDTETTGNISGRNGRFRGNSPGAMGGSVDASTQQFIDNKTFTRDGDRLINFNMMPNSVTKSLGATVP